MEAALLVLNGLLVLLVVVMAVRDDNPSQDGKQTSLFQIRAEPINSKHKLLDSDLHGQKVSNKTRVKK